jgi:hypothetical protein
VPERVARGAVSEMDLCAAKVEPLGLVHFFFGFFLFFLSIEKKPREKQHKKNKKKEKRRVGRFLFTTAPSYTGCRYRTPTHRGSTATSRT